MENNYKIMIVAFYLAKYDRLALTNLNYKNFTQAFRDIAEKFDSIPNTINNRRDDFDPLFEYRAGWHQRELTPKKLSVVENFNHLTEPAFRQIVLNLLQGKNSVNLAVIQETPLPYNNRGVTGKKAEEFFEKWFKINYPHLTLKDTREHGCGYDFFVEETEERYEVKGLAERYGGILFTDKEWAVANEWQEKYYLVLIRECFSDSPSIKIYQNPAITFKPTQNISTVINVSWSISPQDLK